MKPWNYYAVHTILTAVSKLTLYKRTLSMRVFIRLLSVRIPSHMAVENGLRKISMAVSSQIALIK